MSKQSLLIACVAGVIVCALTFGGRARSQKNNHQANPPAAADEIPEHVSYLFLFRHLAHLQKLAEEHRDQGKDGSGFRRRYQQALVVDDDQFETVNETALSCASELEKLDEKARVIVEAFKARYPDGSLPEGEMAPPPPAELLSLQKQRDEAVFRARNRIKEALGDREFARFDEIMKVRLRQDIKRTGPTKQTP